jgi:hypothetical protein
MGRYTTARSFDDRSTEVQAAPTEAEKAAAGQKDILEVSVRACSRYASVLSLLAGARGWRQRCLLAALKEPADCLPTDPGQPHWHR